MKFCRSFVLLLLFMAVSLFLFGCNSYTKATYHVKKGKIVKIDIEKVSSPVEQITKSTKDKAVVYWRNGWGVELSVSLFTPKNPFPHLRLEAFNTDGGLGTFPKKMKAIDLAKIIMSTRTNLKIDKDGVESSPPNPPNKKGAALDGEDASVIPSEPG